MNLILETLAWITGIQTFSFSCYVLYYYINDSNDITEEIEEIEDKSDTTEEIMNIKDTNSTIEDTIEEIVEEINMDNTMKEIVEEDKKKYDLYNFLLNKNNELEELIKHLDTVQNNINIIKEKLEELNNANST
jgi:uncharacterized Zn finger protein (UPF0148 family)